MNLGVLRGLCGCLIIGSLVASIAARDVDVLQSTGAIPAHIAGQFREAVGFQQADSGQYFVFDRRAHAVFGIDEQRTRAWEIVKIGAEPGRIIDPGAFAIEPGGAFAVADAPGTPPVRERIQLFSAAGSRIGGFVLPGRMTPRVVYNTQVLNGIGSMQYTGGTILISQPETSALITEYARSGSPLRSIGRLRSTGHEDDRELHLALNSGIPLAVDDEAGGGFWFVFQTGVPILQRYDRGGALLFERHIEGPEIDDAVAKLPTTWPKRGAGEGLLPLVAPTVRSAAIDRAGRVWIALVAPVTYVFDRDGDKVRTVQFRAAGIISPDSLFFTNSGRILVTPGLYEFQAR